MKAVLILGNAEGNTPATYVVGEYKALVARACNHVGIEFQNYSPLCFRAETGEVVETVRQEKGWRNWAEIIRLES